MVKEKAEVKRNQEKIQEANTTNESVKTQSNATSTYTRQANVSMPRGNFMVGRKNHLYL